MRPTYIICLLFLLAACQKDQLTKEAGILEGQWKLKTVFYENGSRIPAVDEYLTIQSKGFISLEGGEERLKEHGRFTLVERKPQPNTGNADYVFEFAVEKRNAFNKTTELRKYRFLHYKSEYDAGGNTLSVLYISKEELPGKPGDKKFEGLTGR